MGNKNSEPKHPPHRQKRIPWWVFLLCAVCVYPLFYYAIPWVVQGSSETELIVLCRQIAPLVTIPFLLLAACGIYADEPPRDPPE